MPTATPLDAPFDLDADVSWVGYANDALRARVRAGIARRARAPRAACVDRLIADGPAARCASARCRADAPTATCAGSRRRSSGFGRCATRPTHSCRSFLDAIARRTIARAPGRLDVMGGIADYSGSLVLEMPLACATFAIAQQQDATRVDVAVIPRRARHSGSAWTSTTLLAASFAPDALGGVVRRAAGRSLGRVRRGQRVPVPNARAASTRPRHGLRLLITSDVPEGKGVSSSAALEVASMAATAACYGVADGRRRARHRVSVGGEPHCSARRAASWIR